MFRLIPILFLLLAVAIPARASVEISQNDNPPVTISEVYLHEGIPYLAVDDVLSALGLTGHWDSVEHVYRIRTPRGTATISPGSQYLRLGERFVPLADPPRFIDGRLRVAEDFVSSQLPSVLGISIHYRNLNPSAVASDESGTTLDKLFAFLLRKKTPMNGSTLRAVALDPGHGGQDTGSLGAGGIKEKDVALEVARRLEKLVKMQLGIPVYLSRDGDYALDPQQRLKPATRPDVDALILLHAQGSLSPQPHGITLIIRPEESFGEGALPTGEGGSRLLARSLAAALKAAGLDVAGIIQAPLLPLGRGDLPTVLVEMGYLSNPADEALLRDSSGQEKLAGAFFQGLKDFADKQKERRK